MTQNGQQRGAPMAKIQKSLMVNEDLYRLIEAIEESSGANFTRIVTAALFAYIFRTFKDPEKGQGHGPDPVWFRVVVAVEKGEIDVFDVPLDLLDGWIEARERWIAIKSEDSTANKELIDALSKELKDIRGIRRGWKNHIEDFGKTEACIETVGSSWIKRQSQ